MERCDVLENECNCPGCVAARLGRIKVETEGYFLEKCGFIPLSLTHSEHFDDFKKELKCFINNKNRYIIQHYIANVEMDKTGVPEEERVFCIICGMPHKKDSRRIYNDRFFCDICLGMYFAICHVCKKPHPKNQICNYKASYTLRHGDEIVVCNTCIKLYGSCDKCNGIDKKSDLKNIVGEEEDTLKVCEYCFDNFVDICSCCNNSYLKDSATSRASFSNRSLSSYSDGDLCPSCKEYKENIKNYSWKPRPRFTYNKKIEKKREDTLFFGIEHEIMTPRDRNRTHIAAKIKDFFKEKVDFKFAYCKEDSSINHGIEIITQPISWSWYKENKKIFDDYLEFLHNEGIRSFAGGSCGIHIHINKKAFDGPAHLYKFIDFIYNTKHENFVYSISQRTDMHFCSLQTINKNLREEAKNGLTTRRRTAVNLTAYGTAEIRLFRGVIKKLAFHKNIEFAHSLFEFTRIVSFKENNLKHYINFIIERRNKYRNLISFIQKERKRGGFKNDDFKNYKIDMKQIDEFVHKEGVDKCV